MLDDEVLSLLKPEKLLDAFAHVVGEVKLFFVKLLGIAAHGGVFVRQETIAVVVPEPSDESFLLTDVELQNRVQVAVVREIVLDFRENAIRFVLRLLVLPLELVVDQHQVCRIPHEGLIHAVSPPELARRPLAVLLRGSVRAYRSVLAPRTQREGDFLAL